jgi:VIT1/CCC1 family predicted Fe2+/Mn2+ transporter
VPNPDGTATRVPLHVWCAVQDKALDAIAAHAGMSAAELNAVKSAAASGAHDGIAASTNSIVSAVLAGLADKSTLTEADVETAVRAALAHP